MYLLLLYNYFPRIALERELQVEMAHFHDFKGLSLSRIYFLVSTHCTVCLGFGILQHRSRSQGSPVGPPHRLLGSSATQVLPRIQRFSWHLGNDLQHPLTGGYFPQESRSAQSHGCLLRVCSGSGLFDL